MRTFTLVMAMLALAGNAAALETSAGADTVNASQVGLDAKLNATNAITKEVIDEILTCNHQGKLYDSTSGTCINAAEPLAAKIAACTTNKQFYNQTTGACQSLAIPPDTSAQTTTNTNLLNAVLACNSNNQFYNRNTNSCVSGNGGVTSVVLKQCSGNCVTPACPSGYHRTGCSFGPGNSAYVAFGPYGAAQCQCGMSHGAGKLTCTTFCAK